MAGVPVSKDEMIPAPALERDDSSARRYAKTSHLAKRDDSFEQQLNGMTAAEREEALKAAANEEVDSSSEFRRARALTADNLGRIPDADQLAPGIRLPGQIVNPHGTDTDIDVQTSSDADGPANSHETGHTSVGAFGEGGASVPGVPPELDPRTSAFRPHSPGAASVFSVAVQPPGSPKASMIDASEPASPFVDSLSTRDRVSQQYNSTPATAGSSYSASARGSSPPLSTGYPAVDNFSGRLGPGPSLLSRTVASVAPSEAGSVSSSGTGGAQGSTGTADDQELAIRAAYIERQRMREREIMGGEAGIGGTPLAFPPGLSTRMGATSRAGSTVATIGTSSPPHSLDGSEIPDGVASPSRRGSVDSTETLGSVRAPPSVQGFELGSGIESRRMSRGGSSIGFGDSADVPGRRGSEGGLVAQAMDEDQEMAPLHEVRDSEDHVMQDSAAETMAKLAH